MTNLQCVLSHSVRNAVLRVKASNLSKLKRHLDTSTTSREDLSIFTHSEVGLEQQKFDFRCNFKRQSNDLAELPYEAVSEISTNFFLFFLD